MISLGPAERLVAGAIGEPGDRTFYVEVAAGGETHWFVAEKQQVAVLASRSLELVRRLAPDRVPAEPGDLQLGQPAEPVFRIGEIGLSYPPAGDLVTLVFSSTDEDDEPVEFAATLAQLEAMAIVALAVVAAGRPPCPRCNLPMDADGHVCPALNGDLRSTRR